MDIKKLSKSIHAANKKKGFWDKARDEGETLMLVITELAECIEADREGRNGSISLFLVDMARQAKFKYTKKHRLEIKRDFFEKHIKDSVGDELADAFIRLCDYCAGFKVDISMDGIEASAASNGLKSMKLDNLGKELLSICGLLDKATRSMKVACIRLAFAKIIWVAEELRIPLEGHVKMKMWYNSTRKKMHGKKY